MRKTRERFGNTAQPSLPVVEQTFEIDAADTPAAGRTCSVSSRRPRPITPRRTSRSNGSDRSTRSTGAPRGRHRQEGRASPYPERRGDHDDEDRLWTQATLKALSIGKAAAYVVANWDRLIRFIGDARIPLDNNATDRAIRGPVVERKNHYGSKSRRGTEIAAVFYTLLEAAKLVGVDPARYLREAALAYARGAILLPRQ